MKARETFEDCSRCARGCREQHDRSRQRQHRCTFLPSSQWDVPGRHLARYMGGPKLLDGEEPVEDDLARAWRLRRVNPEEPFESNVEGCPGGWYRCEFIGSLQRYLRQPDANGGLSSNPVLDRCEIPLVWEAVQFYEAEQARHRSWFDGVVASD